MDSKSAPPTHDWRTTDQDEIERRRQRARDENPGIENRTPNHPVFGNFRVQSKSGFTYDVEIRDIKERHFSCTCVDFRINGLATCKHVEAVLIHLEKTGARTFSMAKARGSSRIEVVPDASIQSLRIERGLDQLPPRLRAAFTSEGELRNPAAAGQLVTDLTLNPLPQVRLSQDIPPWLDSRRRGSERSRLRRDYEQKVQTGAYPVSETTVPLFPYQREGMLHLAFTERALLADEMGLGKTIQAIAACALLHRIGLVQRVLVITPASLKGEWQEQIQRFTTLPSQIVQGNHVARRQSYENPAFFTLANYEQARADVLEINKHLRPDVVVLDEAQRIKTWNSQTAQSIKRLSSRFAFVLTGTPIENRIDELYSIIDFLDPTVLGPLFRFNREYYEFDDRGRPSAYRNLDKLRATLKPLMLRRRKHDVENELPSRQDIHRYVAMSDAQRSHYASHEQQVAGLVAISQRRALLPREQQKLLRELAMMRMLCDTPYILSGDPEDGGECPKLRELDEVIATALSEDGVKVIVFSEWVRMLELVAQLLTRRKIAHARHTGGIPQNVRRAEILRFKNDPNCRVFLCSESGGVGLNLQVASVVINCDLPWNPARYEQRVARAWRKHQSRPVTVINLIAENTIEHRMLATLAAKQGLADGVLDGKGGLSRMPVRGNSALLERVKQMIAPTPTGRPAAPADPSRAFGALAHAALGPELLACEERISGNPATITLYVVVERGVEPARESLSEIIGEVFGRKNGAMPKLVLLDRATADALAALEASGLMQRTGGATRTLEPDPHAPPPLNAVETARLTEQIERAQKQLKLARLLGADADTFQQETSQAARQAIDCINQALAIRARLNPPAAVERALPSAIAAHWGGSRTRVDSFLNDSAAPSMELLDTLDRVCTSLSPAARTSVLSRK
ncbi:MAG: DEAD/DEAH box helicase [Opitutaceae bacterium]|nr:DEAD/DEAH box helicase [Opitutaceae bacterium]